MSTQITINVSGNRLLQQSRETQAANRQQLTQKEADDKFLADVRQIEATAPPQREGAVPEYGIKEQTSAQRGGIPIGGAQLAYQPPVGVGYGSFVISTMAGAGGYPKYIQPPPPPEEGEAITVIYTPNWAGPAFSDTFVPSGRGCLEPVGGITECYANETYSWTKHIEFVLPAGGKNFVVVLKYTDLASGHRSLAQNNSITLSEIQAQVSSVSKAFIVSPEQVREITLPGAVSNYLDQHLPDLTFNTESIETFNAANQPELIPNFSEETWNGTRLYKDVTALTKVFAQSFGLGIFRYDNFSHNPFGNYWTPAAFAYLKGELPLPSTNVTNYDVMRAYLKELQLPLPSRYISVDDPLLDDYVENTKTKIGIVPVALAVDFLDTLASTGLNEKESDVQIRPGDIYLQFFSFSYIWDWGNPLYCRSQLLQLGFTQADLRP